jgi:hypothetical protein
LCRSQIDLPAHFPERTQFELPDIFHPFSFGRPSTNP